MPGGFLPMTGSSAWMCGRRILVREMAVDEFEDEDEDEFETRFDGHERRGVAPVKVVERRQHKRYAVDVVAEVLVLDGTLLFRGQVLDISAAGCYIETEARLRLAPGTPVEMVFRARDIFFRLDATSRSVRPGRGAGFLFSNLNARMQEDLAALIAELDRSTML